MRSKNFVPLPEVSKHTDSLRIASLGLPVGFDEERLAFNVTAFEKVMKWGDLRSYTVCAEEGERRSIDVGIDGANSDGTTNAIGKAAISKVKLQNTSLKEEGISDDVWVSDVFYERAEAVVRINSSEKEQRILDKSNRWPRGPLEPKAQAYFIDRAARQGLRTAVLKNHYRKYKELAVVYGAGLSVGCTIIQEPPPPDILIDLQVLALLHAVYAQARGLSVKDRQWSLLPVAPIDRHIMARGHASRTLVKAIA